VSDAPIVFMMIGMVVCGVVGVVLLGFLLYLLGLGVLEFMRK